MLAVTSLLAAYSIFSKHTPLLLDCVRRMEAAGPCGGTWSCCFLFVGRTSFKTVAAVWIQRKENVLLPPTMTVQPIASLRA